ncbi:MAG: helical backbone metal receptor [Burkholderiaceae bacterium]|nr:helical backbone metal receptor [Burkholderiaceae bacterium]
MSKHRHILALMIGLVITATTPDVIATSSTPRVVSLGGSVTEIVYALDAQDLLVGVDQSSIFPPQARDLPSVGYYRRLGPESVASLKPTVVIASEHAGPPQAIEQLRGLGVPVILVPDTPTVESLRERVLAVAKALNRGQQAVAVLQNFDQNLRKALDAKSKPAVAMLIVMRGGKMLGAGSGTNAEVLIQKSGLNNALSHQTGYQPLSAEVVTAIAPDVLIVTASSVNALGGINAVKQQTALKHTPAVQNDRIVVLDDLLAMGFGLRLPEAIERVKTGSVHGNSR